MRTQHDTTKDNAQIPMLYLKLNLRLRKKMKKFFITYIVYTRCNVCFLIKLQRQTAEIPTNRMRAAVELAREINKPYVLQIGTDIIKYLGQNTRSECEKDALLSRTNLNK